MQIFIRTIAGIVLTVAVGLAGYANDNQQCVWANVVYQAIVDFDQPDGDKIERLRFAGFVEHASEAAARHHALYLAQRGGAGFSLKFCAPDDNNNVPAISNGSII